MPDGLEPFDVSVLWPDADSGNGKRNGGGRLWISASSRLGAVHGVPRDLKPATKQDLEEYHVRFQDKVARAASGADWAATVGRDLAELIFGVPEIVALFHRTRGAAVDRGGQLLVRVQAAPARAAAIPWELLADPDAGSRPVPVGAKGSPAVSDSHLTFAPDAHVARIARARTYPVRTAAVAPPLNVLLVLSNPDGESKDEIPFDLFEEQRLLLSELQPLIDRGLLRVDVEDSPTVENLRRRIGSRLLGYHAVHYLGHADPTRLKLEDAERRTRWVDAERFSAVLSACPDLRLVFYAGCRTAAQQTGQVSWPEVLGVADRTVRDACPMVVGMQAELPFPTEKILTRFFYQALAAGQSVAQALKLARAAIRDDDLVGGHLLDWAVPSLITSTTPDAIVDTTATVPAPPPKRRRVELRLDLVEADREFFARQAELRRVIDVLCRRRSIRVLWIVGPPRSGKTRLMARALDELDAVEAVLYIRASQLLGESESDRHPEGPVGRLNELVVELLARGGRPARPRDVLWKKAEEWWARLIEDLTDTSFVLVIDAGEELDEADPGDVAALGEALSRLVQRRTLARLALVGTSVREGFLADDVADFATVQVVKPLGFRDVWQWIRRNRPVLVRFGSERLAPFYSRLPSLESWSELARLVHERPLVDLGRLVDELAPPQPDVPSATGGALDEAMKSMPDAPVPPKRPDSPLRVAAAGQHFIQKEEAFAAAATAFASAHEVAGRVVTSASSDASASIAELLRIPSPFADGWADTFAMVRWFETAVEQGSDLLLLDVGAEDPAWVPHSAIINLSRLGVLLVAAAGNSLKPVWPAWYPEVLAVGALTGARKPRPAPYSYWDRDTRKPELFAPEMLTGTPFEPLVGLGTKGSSIAAVNVVAAALLVWAVDRTQTAADVREVLVRTGRPLSPKEPDGPRCLDTEAALGFVRQAVIRRPLMHGPLDLDGLVGATGLETDLVHSTLRNLIATDQVLESSTARGSVYRLRTSSMERSTPGRSPLEPAPPVPSAAQP